MSNVVKGALAATLTALSLDLGPVPVTHKRGKKRRNRRHNRTRMSPFIGRILDALRRATPPGSPGKINFRRSDPRHPKHERIFHNGADCTCAGPAE